MVTVALAAGALSGKYKTKVGGSTWIVAFKPSGYTVFMNGRAFVSGTDSIKGNKIAFTDTGGRREMLRDGHLSVQAVGHDAHVQEAQRRMRMQRSRGGARREVCEGRLRTWFDPDPDRARAGPP